MLIIAMRRRNHVGILAYAGAQAMRSSASESALQLWHSPCYSIVKQPCRRAASRRTYIGGDEPMLKRLSILARAGGLLALLALALVGCSPFNQTSGYQSGS